MTNHNRNTWSKNRTNVSETAQIKHVNLVKASHTFFTMSLTNTVAVYLADKMEFKCEATAGTDRLTVDSQREREKIYNKRETKDTVNTWLIDTTERIKWRKPRLSFRNSGHIAKHLTPACRECAFSFWAAAVYSSSICQERAAACRRCTHRLCLVNSTSDIYETAEGCRSTEIDFLFLFFGLFFFFFPHRFLTTKHLCIKKPQWVYLEVGAIYRNLVNQAWINTGVAVDLEHFKRLQKKWWCWQWQTKGVVMKESGRPRRPFVLMEHRKTVVVPGLK